MSYYKITDLKSGELLFDTRVEEAKDAGVFCDVDQKEIDDFLNLRRHVTSEESKKKIDAMIEIKLQKLREEAYYKNIDPKGHFLEKIRGGFV